MKFELKARRLPALQTIGMLAVVFIFGLIVSSYFFYALGNQKQQQLDRLEQKVLQQQEGLLLSELDATASYIQYMRTRTEQVLRAQSKVFVDQAVAVAESIYAESKDRLSDTEIKTLIRESLRNVRFFEGRGYLFIDDLEGMCVLLPTAPHLEGSSLYDNRDDTGHYIMRGLIDAVSNNAQQSGFSRYRWYAPSDHKLMEDKIAYVRLFEPYNWIIGAGDYLYRVENDLKQEVTRRLENFRFGDNGYISVLDLQGNTLANTALTVLSETRDVRDLHRVAIDAIMDTAASGGGIVEYSWFYPDGRGPVVKRSQVKVVPEWGWVLVAGIYPDDLAPMLAEHKATLDAQSADAVRSFVLVMVAGLLLALILALVYSRWLRRIFIRYEQDIEHQRSQLMDNSRQLELSARVFENATEGIMITDALNRILAVNPAFTEITGYSQEEAEGKNPSFMASGSHNERFYEDMWSRLMKTGRWQGEVWNRRKDGVLFPEWLSLNLVREDGDVVNHIATLSDISLSKANEKRLRYLVEYDSLTDLPNRRLLADRVDQAVHIARHNHSHLALLFVDLDRFKNVNDSLGHEVGDRLLCAVAERLTALVDDLVTVSRVGGDEFVILLSDLNHPNDAALVARDIIQHVSQPVELGGHSLTLTPSIGIALYPGDGLNFEMLFRNADAALYHAKAQGRNQYQFFTQQINDDVSRSLVMENALRKGIAEGELRLVYQPQFCMKNMRLYGVEALVRWQHPEQGLVPPDFFIGLAEETGLILELGAWVMYEACLQGQRWREEGFPDIELAVNVSALQFREELVDQIRRVLEETGFPAENLVIEVTESTLMQGASEAIGILRRLKELGVWVSLDDFGTGYSSLAYLKRFPLDKLKIDKAFISDLPHDADDSAITRAIISLAQSLSLLTVAEGVETTEQLEYLQALGCDLAQGYLLDRPLWPDDMTSRFKAEMHRQVLQDKDGS
ncbi:cache domain-containing protein [Oceanospirillum sp.]|uniref:bifunctional diguanylate cyclase/phosphodiesterase n=1 Tax=Oceanospirillum sp. TaxID=2021254 RepID=UPI003A8E613B